jgi:hypothetical protein
VVEIAPCEVFAVKGIISLVLLNFSENALQKVDNEPNEKATTKAKSPIEFVLCHGRFRFVGRDVVCRVSTMMVYPT